MKIALLGTNASTLAMAEAVRAAGFDLAAAAEADKLAEPLSRVFRDVRILPHWSELLEGGLADAIVVAGESPDRFEQLRAILQAEIALLVPYPLLDVLSCYELEAIREDKAGVIAYYPSWRLHPACDELLPQASSLGKLEQIVCERFLADRSKENILRSFAHDVDLLRALAGQLTQVTAMAPGVSSTEQDPHYANLGVQLAGSAETVVRWSVSPLETAAGARLVLWGEKGKVSLQVPEGTAASWECHEELAGEEPRTQTFPDWNPYCAALDELQAVAGGKKGSMEWLDAIRAMELAEAVQRSLSRRRMIELRPDEHSEEAAFKGTMAMVGCGLLLLSVPLFALGVFASQFKIPLLSYLNFLILGVLAIFLMLQFFRFLVPAKDAAASQPNQETAK